jgi:hypothetical protein
MALTLLRSKRRRITNGFEVVGVAQFTTTSLTGELKCELNTLEDFTPRSSARPAPPPARTRA